MAPDPVSSPSSSPARRAPVWLKVIAALVAVTAFAIAALATAVGVQMRSASSRTRALCTDHPMGSPADAVEVERIARARGLFVRVSAPGPGVTLVEATAGALTAVYRCEIEVQNGRVASSRAAHED